jgi:hypothetical protein
MSNNKRKTLYSQDLIALFEVGVCEKLLSENNGNLTDKMISCNVYKSESLIEPIEG